MFSKEFNFGFKTLRLISLIIVIIGLVFIFASKFIGIFSIRVAAIGLIVFSLINFNFSTAFAINYEKLLSILGIVGGILVFIFPGLAMFLIGIGLMVFAVPIIYKAIKKRDFSDIITFSIAIIAFCFAVYCIINGKAAISTVVKLIGIILAIIGCIFFYRSIDLEKSTNSFMNDIKNGVDEYKFTSAEEIEEE